MVERFLKIKEDNANQVGRVKRITPLLNKAQQLERCTVVRTETGLLGGEEGVNERREIFSSG